MNEAAQALGRLGGLATSEKLSAEQRRKRARDAAAARWAKTTPAGRRKVGRALVAARKKKRAQK